MSGQQVGLRIDRPENRYPKELILKDGHEITLRPVGQEDLQGLYQFYSSMASSLRWYMKTDPCNSGEIQKWINNQKDGRAFAIVADHEGRIVAHASLLMRPYGSRQHVGRLRVYVAETFRRRQLGTWMVFDLVRYAMDRGLEMLRTDFVVGVEDAAIKAVRKLDFVTEGIIKDYVRDPDGRCHDYQVMIKQLHQGWDDF